jgi:anti-anti-sigma regulatory factor
MCAFRAVFGRVEPVAHLATEVQTLLPRRSVAATAHVADEPFRIALVGEFDMARECELLTRVITLDPPPDTTVEVDASEVTFVDSWGLNGILRAQGYLHGRCCQLILRRPQPQLLRLLELVGLTDRLVNGDGHRR